MAGVSLVQFIGENNYMCILYIIKHQTKYKCNKKKFTYNIEVNTGVESNNGVAVMSYGGALPLLFISNSNFEMIIIVRTNIGTTKVVQ